MTGRVSVFDRLGPAVNDSAAAAKTAGADNTTPAAARRRPWHMRCCSTSNTISPPERGPGAPTPFSNNTRKGSRQPGNDASDEQNQAPPGQQSPEVPKLKVALDHPLITRQLLPLAQQQGGGHRGGQDTCRSKSSQASNSTVEQVLIQAGFPSGRRSHGTSLTCTPRQLEILEQLRQLRTERDAAEDMLQQMMAQTQALLAEKAALQQQTATLSAQKQQLEERLEYLELQDWTPGADADSLGVSQGGTPMAADAAMGGMVTALHSRLSALAEEQQELLLLLDQAGQLSPDRECSSPGPDPEAELQAEQLQQQRQLGAWAEDEPEAEAGPGEEEQQEEEGDVGKVAAGGDAKAEADQE